MSIPSTASTSLKRRTRPSTSMPLLRADISKNLSRSPQTPVLALHLRTQGTRMATTTSIETQLDSWVFFLRAHAAITRELSADLQREHGLTLNDYEVLLHLSHAD